MSRTELITGIERRLAMNLTGKRRVVVIMRQRGGNTLPFVFKSEASSVLTIGKHVAPGSTIYADDASGWNALDTKFTTKRINHSECYSDGSACANQAESFFTRLRRAEIGTHHHISGYLSAYAGEMAWPENNRRVSNGEQFHAVANAALVHVVSSQWAGYWQRRAA